MKKIFWEVIAIILIVGLAVGGFFIWKNTHKDDKKNNENISVEEQIRNEFSKELSVYDDYRIEKVEILNDERTKQIIDWDRGQYYKDGDVLATITYSIKSDEVAGNGEQQGDWVVDKIVCIAFRDGKIVSAGTGW